jgi:peptidoglycan/LPS O-acetylase OafA/YrhL
MEKLQKSSFQRTEWISSAKGIAIIGVLAVHVGQHFNLSRHLKEITESAQFSVQLFFILSSFLIFKSLSAGQPILNTKLYFHFIAHKTLRLMPVLYAAVFLHTVLQLLNKAPISLSDILFAVSFLNGLSPHHINPYMNWYVGALFLFTLTAPLLFRTINSRAKAVLFFVISNTVCCLSDLAIAKLGNGSNSGGFYYFWLIHQMPSLSFGIIVYFFSDLEDRSGIAILALVLSIYSLLNLTFPDSPYIFQINFRYGFCLLIFSYASHLVLGRGMLFLSTLGSFSYGIYLFHPVFLDLFEKALSQLTINRSSVALFSVYSAALLICSYLFSFYFNKFIEKPILLIAKRRLNL